MDGGRRLLRSIGICASSFAHPRSALFGNSDALDFAALKQAAPQLPHRRLRRRDVRLGIERLAGTRFLGTALVLTFFAGVTVYGVSRGGMYASFVADHGTIPDILARTSGFAIKAVTVTGTRELSEAEVLKLSGVGANDSLVFLSAAGLRARLRAVPLIREASISKLYPNHLLVEIEERQPTAIWQKDGAVSIVAADGTPIDDMHDPRFERLPLVVGEGANQRLAEYQGILDAAGDLRARIKAGIYVAGRRWTLKTTEDLAIDLPEQAPADAISRFARLEHDEHILEKDLTSLDLRIHGRVVVHLTPEAGAARAAALDKKSKKKGAST